MNQDASQPATKKIENNKKTKNFYIEEEELPIEKTRSIKDIYIKNRHSIQGVSVIKNKIDSYR